VIDCQASGSPDDLRICKLSRLQDHLEVTSLGHSRSDRVESDHDIVDSSRKKISVGQHDIDFIGTVCQTSTDQPDDLGRLVTSSREIDDSRDRNPRSFELPHCARHEPRPDAHGSDIPMRTMSAGTEVVDVGFGTRIVEIREIDEFENSLSELPSRRCCRADHDTKPDKFSGPKDVGSNVSIVKMARTPFGPHA